MPTRTKTLHESRGWTVVAGEDGTFDVLDRAGEVVDGAYTLEDAIAACDEGSLESYRERLWEAITEADIEDVQTCFLEQVADLLGLNHKTI